MLLNLLVWLYISWICLAWGNIFIRKSLSPFLLCFAGLAVTGILAAWLALFLPAGWLIHAFLLLPAIIYNVLPEGRKTIRKQVGQLFSGYTPLTAFLAAGCMLMILLISSHLLIHPDTLSYHTKAIQWAEHYKAVPGLANTDNELGLQSWWFILHAVFRFSFIAPNSFLFLNGCVVAWFLLFVIARINEMIQKVKQGGTNIIPLLAAWIMLLIFTLVSWTQVRLTAASASPDFVVALYIWGAIYFFLSAENSNLRHFYLPATLFCCAAITAKLSGIAIFLLPVSMCFILLYRKQFKRMAALIAIIVLSIIPFIARNVITTGYPLYPTEMFDVSTVDWKAPRENLVQFQQYISGYARGQVNSYEDAARIMQLPLQNWLPQWWSGLALPDKILLGVVIVLLLFNLITLKTQAKRKMADLVVLAISLTGSIIWFIKAPDPRFGVSFLVPLVFSLAGGITYAVKTIYYKSAIMAANILILAYIVFRLITFFEPRQIIVPLGVKNAAYTTVNCSGIIMYRSNIQESGFIPFPAINDSCGQINLRGKNIESGFRAKQ